MVDDVLEAARRSEVEVALYNGDAAPRIALWSHTEPVTLFGAHYSVSGVAEAQAVFRPLGETFSDCTAYDVELAAAAASGDMACTVSYERPVMSIDGVPTSWELRVTQVCRREEGRWGVVHRHGDAVTREEL